MDSHNDLENYIKTVFNMQYFHRWSVTEIENLIPFELDVYIALLQQQKEKEKKK